MPEFHIDLGDADAARAYQALDAFTRGYIEAAFFTETGDPDDAEQDLEHASFAELASKTLAKMVADCARFMPTLDAVKAQYDGDVDAWPDDEHAGRDFWYTRNGHGCGFWDGDWPEPYATILNKHAKQFGTVDLYRGDDGLIYS